MAVNAPVATTRKSITKNVSISENIPTTKSAGKKSVTINTRQPLIGKAKASPIQSRPALSEGYERPVSHREGWWRKTIKETPIPGAYESETFLVDLEKKPATYRFKGDGRKMDAHPHGKGATLMPGAYQHKDFLYNLHKGKKTYNFKSVDRDSQDFLNFGKKDRDINVCPTAYEIEKYLTLTVDKQPSKHYFFRSASHRFPTVYFKPKEGPPPGNYEYCPPGTLHAVSSSFKSKTPRFHTSHTKIPGPGTYEKTFQSPMPSTIQKMGRQHGLFFSSAFQV